MDAAEDPRTATERSRIESGILSRRTARACSFWLVTQDPLAVTHQVADEVGDRVGLASAGRALHGDASVDG